jgi:hypothetical protein
MCYTSAARSLHCLLSTLLICKQELRRRFAVDGSTATSFAVNPGAVHSDIWRTIPSFLAAPAAFVMKRLFLTVEQGCYTSVVTATAPLQQLQELYYQPYYLPLGIPHPFEVRICSVCNVVLYNQHCQVCAVGLRQCCGAHTAALLTLCVTLRANISVYAACN